jgi:hypothetical protein
VIGKKKKMRGRRDVLHRGVLLYNNPSQKIKKSLSKVEFKDRLMKHLCAIRLNCFVIIKISLLSYLN